jgi:hypothetical protein
MATKKTAAPAEETIPATAETKSAETELSTEAISASAFCDITGVTPRVRFVIERLYAAEVLSLEAWTLKTAPLIN